MQLSTLNVDKNKHGCEFCSLSVTVEKYLEKFWVIIEKYFNQSLFMQMKTTGKKVQEVSETDYRTTI